MTNAAWFIGKLLLNRKRQAEAVPWLKRAASSPNTGKWTCVLATAELTRLGIEIPPRRDSEIDAELVPVLTLQRAAAKSWEAKDLAGAADAVRRGARTQSGLGAELDHGGPDQCGTGRTCGGDRPLFRVSRADPRASQRAHEPGETL